MTEKRKSFVAGAALLAGAGLIGKVIGAFYRVWMSALIGVESGMVIFSLPYSVYSFLLVISSAGLPTAISRMVSTRIATGDRAGAREVARSARRMLFVTGLLATVFMFAFARPLAAMTGDEAAAPAFMALAPSVFIVCMISSYRGYFQGMQKMTPTALSQLVEQIGKLVIGFPLAAWLMPRGFVWGAVGAIAGVTLSELAALALMFGANMGQRMRDRDIERPAQREKGILRSLLAIAIPITIGASMMPIVGLVDSYLVINRLQSAGLSIEAARAMYGPLTNIAKSIVDMPAVITLAMSTSLVPAISSALARKEEDGARSIATTGLKLAALIGMPAAVGMSILAGPIVQFLYGSQSAEAKTLGAQLLTVMAVGVFFLSLIQTSAGIFQGLGKPAIPVATLGVGIVVKIILNYVLVATPGIYVMGAAYATLTCYAIAATLNVAIIAKLTRAKGKRLLELLRPAVAAIGMGAALLGVRAVLQTRVGNTTYLAIGVLMGVAVYGGLLVLTRALSEEDMRFLPGGGRIKRLFAGKGAKRDGGVR